MNEDYENEQEDDDEDTEGEYEPCVDDVIEGLLDGLPEWLIADNSSAKPLNEIHVQDETGQKFRIVVTEMKDGDEDDDD